MLALRQFVTDCVSGGLACRLRPIIHQDPMANDTGTHILVVDDEAQVRSLLRARFEKEGFAVSEAENGSAMREQLEKGSISLVTLDLTLGQEDGLALAREIRARRNVPIIMISAKDDEVDRIVGLELGADDYITKPFSPREVVARVRAVLRRYGATTDGGSQTSTQDGQRLSFEGGTLDLSRRDFKTSTGELTELTTTDFNLLELFLRRPQRVMSRDEIMNSIKGHDWNPFDRSVDSAVARLRKKIEADADRPRFIKSVRGVGYVLSADVRRI
jgi:two-component system OmpR family response regulator